MPAEKTPRDLIGEAFKIQQDRKVEEVSVEKARKRIPELTTKIDKLVKDETPYKHNSLTARLETIRVTFLVPVSREETVSVSVSQETVTSWDTRKRWEIDIEQLDSKLVIGEKGASVESKEHRYKPFDRHTPIGPGSNSDLGPVWYREMNMTDFAAYNRVLDRLVQPDVTRKD